MLLPFDKANYRPKELETVVAFKNQSLKTDFEKIQQFPEMKYYDVSETEVKVPAGWLIEQAGFKGNALETLAFIKNIGFSKLWKCNRSRNFKCFKIFKKRFIKYLHPH
jgi:hypothetical protein